MRAGDVGVDVELRVFQRRANPGPRGKVDDGVEAALGDGFLDEIAASNISFVKSSGAAELGEVRAFDAGVVVVVEIINDFDLVAVPNQPSRHMGSDKTSSPRYQNSHRRTLESRFAEPQEVCFFGP